MFDTLNLHIEFTCVGEASFMLTAMKNAYALVAGEPDVSSEVRARCFEAVEILDVQIRELRLAMAAEDARDEGRLQMVGSA